MVENMHKYKIPLCMFKYKDIINEINGNKKFCAIPVNSFITKLEQNRIPWDFHFKEIFAKNKFLMIGNTDIYLTDTEIKSII